VAGALLGDSGDVEDVVHDVFVGFASQAGRFELKGSLKGYLAICAANRARNVMRQGRQVETERRATDKLERVLQPDSSETATRAEQHRIVRSALADLPSEQRQVIVLHVFGSLRFGEIARQTGASVNTIKSRYRYGIQKLRSVLDGQVEL
jgi:RNA polymerase sigma-70 factor (ECF subfamily)